jgi:hypothetical protein
MADFVGSGGSGVVDGAENGEAVNVGASGKTFGFFRK